MNYLIIFSFNNTTTPCQCTSINFNCDTGIFGWAVFAFNYNFEVLNTVICVLRTLGYWLSDFTNKNFHSLRYLLYVFISMLLTLHINYMNLSYTNYVISKVDSKFSAHNTLTDLSRTRQNENRLFRFSLSPERESIYAQATFFSNYIVASGVFENTFITSNRNIDQVTTLVANTYMYSYVKSILYAHGRVNRNIIYMMGPNNNLVFHGHKVLHDLISEGYMQYFSMPSNVISMQIDIDQDIIETLESWDIYSLGFNNSTNTFFNQSFESVLGWLNNKAKGLVQIGEIGSTLCNETYNMSTSPLGNLCYSKDMLTLRFIENSYLATDKVSYYFGKANMLYIVESPEVDSDDNVYDTIPISRYDTFGVTFEVQSITGYNPLSKIMSSRDIQENRGGGNSTGPTFGRPFSPGKGTNPRNPKSGQHNPNTNPSGDKTTTAFNNNKLDTAGRFITNKRNQAVSIGKDVIQVVRNVDDVLTNDNVNKVARLVSVFTGKNISPKDFRNRIGNRILSVLSDFNISPNDRQALISGEFDEFYSIEEKKNGVIKHELIGAQKLLTYT